MLGTEADGRGGWGVGVGGYPLSPRVDSRARPGPRGCGSGGDTRGWEEGVTVSLRLLFWKVESSPPHRGFVWI